MEKYLLFTAAGRRDPVSGFHDGPMLHVCRVYRPERVYIYLSARASRKNSGNLFRKSVKRLSAESGFPVDKIVITDRPEMSRVRLFDVFYDEFERELDRIERKNPGYKILINTSSGTPAMRSALEIIASLNDRDVTAVRVSAPEKRDREMPRDLDFDALWELDSDRAPDFENRCFEIRNINLSARIKKDIVAQLVASYDYSAALRLAEKIRRFVPPQAVSMIKAASCRLRLDFRGYNRACRDAGEDFMPYKSGERRDIFEYVLNLMIKEKQEDYADFVRAITPLTVDILEILLKEKFDVDISACCKKKKSGRVRWDIKAMEKSEKGRLVKKALSAKFGYINVDAYGSASLARAVEYLGADAGTLRDIEMIRDVEENIRNLAAHEIVSVTAREIEKRTGLSPAGITAAIRRLLKKAGFSFGPGGIYLRSYEEMNRRIARLLK